MEASAQSNLSDAVRSVTDTSDAVQWQVPGPLDMYRAMGWCVVAGWVYLALCVLYTWSVIIDVLRHVLTKMPPSHRLTNSLLVVNFAVASTLCAAAVFDPRYQPLFDLIRDLCVGAHLSLMGWVLVYTCDGPAALVERLRRLWDANKRPPYCQLSPRVEHLQKRYWWLLQPEKNPCLYVYTWLVCLVQYPLLLAGVQFYTLAGIWSALMADPHHFWWAGVNVRLNAVCIMSFWLCAIGRNHLYGQQMPLLDFGDVMRDRERTMFLLLDFVWLQGLATMMFPQVGLRLANMNEYVTYAVLLRALIVVQLAAASVRVRRFWKEPLDNSSHLPPIHERMAARERRLKRGARMAQDRDSDSEMDVPPVVNRDQDSSTKTGVVRRNVTAITVGE